MSTAAVIAPASSSPNLLKNEANGSSKTLLDALQSSNPQDSLKRIVFDSGVDANLREDALVELVKSLAENDVALLALFKALPAGLFAGLPRPRPAIIVKKVLEVVRFGVQANWVLLFADLVTWAERESRTVLARGLQSRLAEALLASGKTSEAIALAQTLSRTLSRIDDKLALLEVQLLEGQAWLGLGSYAKARASLTAARNTASLVAAAPASVARLEDLCGRLQMEENEPSLALASFIEALDTLVSARTRDPTKCTLALCLVLLAKIVAGEEDEVAETLRSKIAAPFAEAESVKVLVSLASAYSQRSLSDFQACLLKGQAALPDQFILKHLHSLYDRLLEGNLLKIVMPYSKVSISRIALSIGLSEALIESRLCTMILDGILPGGLIDQQTQTLVINPVLEESALLSDAQSIMKALSQAIDNLVDAKLEF